MSETNDDASKPSAVFEIQAVYVKDLSFESPHSPQIFRADWKPEIRLNLTSNANEKSQQLYEIVLTVSVTVSVGEETAFLAEVQQAGLFRISGIAREELASTLGSYCPNVLFPYAREAIANMANRGGFPALNLMPVNFEALYQQNRQANQAGDTSAQS